MRKEDAQAAEKEREKGRERERDSAERRCNSVGLCIESAVAGRTCRDHGGLMRLRKRRPHGQADAFQSRSFARSFVRSFLHAVTVSKLGQARILPAMHHAVSSPFGFRETRAYVIPEINLVKHSTRHPPSLSDRSGIRSDLLHRFRGELCLPLVAVERHLLLR